MIGIEKIKMSALGFFIVLYEYVVLTKISNFI